MHGRPILTGLESEPYGSALVCTGPYIQYSFDFSLMFFSKLDTYSRFLGQDFALYHRNKEAQSVSEQYNLHSTGRDHKIFLSYASRWTQIVNRVYLLQEHNIIKTEIQEYEGSIKSFKYHQKKTKRFS